MYAYICIYIYTSPRAVTQRMGVECAVDPAMILVFNSSICLYIYIHIYTYVYIYVYICAYLPLPWL